MAVPKRKQSKSRTKKRRTHYTVATATVSKCLNCGEAKMPHYVCPHCGTYRKRQIIEVAALESA